MAQEELDVYPFSRITDYHSRDERFHMRLKTVRKASDFVCETAHVSEPRGGGHISQNYCSFSPFSG